MDVNGGAGRRRRARSPSSGRVPSPPSLGRRARSGFRMPPAGEGPAPEYPRSLLRLPSAAMFLLMREMFRIGQERSAAATTAEEQMRFPHLAVLAAIDEFGAASQRDISRRLRIDRGTNAIVGGIESTLRSPDGVRWPFGRPPPSVRTRSCCGASTSAIVSDCESFSSGRSAPSKAVRNRGEIWSAWCQSALTH
jgi:hypothetical protein